MQGFIMGVFGSAGAGARVVFPVMAGVIIHFFGKDFPTYTPFSKCDTCIILGERVLFIVLIVVCGVSIAAVAFTRKALAAVTSH